MSSKRYIDKLTFLSWNIHGNSSSTEGEKSNNKEFIKVFSACELFCLQETKEKVSLPHYKCYNKNRATSKSGGLCIGIHRTITLKVEDVNTECEDIQALRMKFFFDSPKRDLLIVNIYDSPKQSSHKYKRANKNGSQE